MPFIDADLCVEQGRVSLAIVEGEERAGWGRIAETVAGLPDHRRDDKNRLRAYLPDLHRAVAAAFFRIGIDESHSPSGNLPRQFLLKTHRPLSGHRRSGQPIAIALRSQLQFRLERALAIQ